MLDQSRDVQRQEGEELQHPQYYVGLAHTPSEIREAQKLRYRIFSGEMGATLHCKEEGVDSDFFDPFCQHLIVRDEAQGRIVGTYRILTPEAARQVGAYYSESEFDLTRFNHLRPRGTGPLLHRSGIPQRHRDRLAVDEAGRVHDQERLRILDGLCLRGHG